MSGRLPIMIDCKKLYPEIEVLFELLDKRKDEYDGTPFSFFNCLINILRVGEKTVYKPVKLYAIITVFKLCVKPENIELLKKNENCREFREMLISKSDQIRDEIYGDIETDETRKLKAIYHSNIRLFCQITLNYKFIQD